VIIKDKNSCVNAKVMELAVSRIEVPHRQVNFTPKASTQRPKHRSGL
jgi:hypothetical protein